MDSRKKQILEKIIEHFLKTAEPVGSHVLNQQFFPNLSTASLRREMSLLENLGYLTHPHTSAGRIPTTSGYRFYVNSLFEKGELSLNEKTIIKNKLSQANKNIESILEVVVNILAEATNCPSLAFFSETKNIKIIFFDIVLIDNHNLLLIIVDSNQIVYKKNIVLNTNINIKVVKKLTQILQKFLVGITLKEANTLNIKFLEQQIYSATGFVPELIKQIIKESISLEVPGKIYIKGKNIIFKFPEFQSSAKAMPLIEFLENKNFLNDLFNKSYPQLQIKEEEPFIKVIIGEENPYKEMQDCSLVFSAQKALNFLISFGVIGPKRMPYTKAIFALQFIVKNLNLEILGV